MKKLTSLIVLFLFMSSAFSQSMGTFRDSRDGQSYKFVRIGNQAWMAENLKYNSRGSCYYDLYQFGRLYNWEIAKQVCPRGWHLPSDSEWITLEIYLGLSGDEAYIDDWRESGEVGEKLKTKTGWNEGWFDDGPGNNKSGFSAKPGGFYQFYNERFMWWGNSALFWTSTSYDNKNGWFREVSGSKKGIIRGGIYRVHGLSVRCVKD